MKNIKKLILAGAVILAIGATTATAFAAVPYNTPAEALAGKQEAFRAEMLQIKKDRLADRVEAGLITQERADEIIAAIEENQAFCDGTGSERIGQRMGAGFGGMQGNGNGQGNRGFGQCGFGADIQ
ncbi:MAG: DUF2680 domain-containing protein [Eubacteriales bacterium]|nr:DUF2680 domain-containing protein [Eubacteriales bacterium]